MLRHKHIIYIILIISALSAGCFEEDEKVPPHIPGDEQHFAFDKSIYFTQSYFDLSSNSILAENGNAEWVLRFAAQARDWHIGVNSGNYWGVYNTGTDNPDSIPDNNPAPEEWIFDHSSGDLDSSAFAGWVNFAAEDTTYTNNIYLLGTYDGLSFKASWAVQFTHVDESCYKFRMRAVTGVDWQDFEISKSQFHNYQHFTTSGGGQQVQIEPDRDLWDLQFTQYGTIIFTNEGVPTPYYVRGVLMNRHMVSAAVDSLKAFVDITFEDVAGYRFSRQQDFIGYEWKDVEVDINSGTAVYTVIPGITFIIMDTEGFFYKLRFVSYSNGPSERGFPVFEHLRL